MKCTRPQNNKSNKGRVTRLIIYVDSFDAFYDITEQYLRCMFLLYYLADTAYRSPIGSSKL